MHVAPYRLWLVMAVGIVIAVIVVVDGIGDAASFRSIATGAAVGVGLSTIAGLQLLWIKRHPR